MWGALMGHQTGCLTCVPCMEGMQAGPSQHRRSQPGKPGLRAGPWLPQPCGLSEAPCMSQLRSRWVKACARRLGSCLQKQGSSGKQSVGRGWQGEREPRRGLQRALWPEVSCSAERSEVRGAAQHMAIPPSKMGRPS